MKWTKTHRKKLSAIIHPHKSDPADFFPSAAKAWAASGISGEPPSSVDKAWAIKHFNAESQSALTSFFVETLGLTAAVDLIRAASDACEYDVLPYWSRTLRRYFYRAEEAEFNAVKERLFDDYKFDERRGRALAAFAISRDKAWVEATIAAQKIYVEELVAAAPTAELALQVVAKIDSGLRSFALAFDLVENLGVEATPVLEALAARYTGKASFRKPIDQALKLVGASPAKKKPAKKAADKKVAAKATTPASSSTSASPGEAAFSKYIVANSTSGGKFWEVEVKGAEMRIRYGKLGADPKWSSKTFDSQEKAIQEATKKFKSKTKKGYAETERPVEVSTSATPLAESHVVGTFYFRALDRSPGGNIDTTTVKVAFRAGPGEIGALTAKQYANWDGEHFTYTEAPLTLDISKTAPAMVKAAQSMIDGGLAASTFTIIDARRDSDEYDTEWSSLEFTIHTLPSADADHNEGKLVLHVVQKALSYTKQKGSPPDALSQTFLDSVQALVGIGRVVDLNESSPFRSAYKPKSTSHGYQSKDIPLFL